MMIRRSTPVDRVDTPAILIDLDILERNIAGLAEMARIQHKDLRPHIKTHKIPQIADLQLHAGAIGITCAKVGEAEVMIEKSRVTDIFIAYQIVGESKIRRLLKLAEHPKLRTLSVGADSVAVAQPISDAARRRGLKIPVVLKTDVGYARTGVAAGRPTLDLARKISRMSGLTLAGLYGYEGQIFGARSAESMRSMAFKAARRLTATADLLREDGFEVPVLSLGATPSRRFLITAPGITELRCGTYVFNDQMQINYGSATEEDCALSIVATVISVPAADRAVIDAGSKTLTSEKAAEFGIYGRVKGRPDLRLVNATEEHGMIRLTEPRQKLRVGDRLEIIPNHVCPVVNLHDEVVAVRDGRVAAVWPIAARGKIR